MKKKNFPITNIGSVSLMMIFIVLCMVTFAALSLSEAAADYRFSLKMAEHTTQYYEASNSAEEMLASIDGMLADCWAQTDNEADYYKVVSDEVGKMDKVNAEIANDSLFLSYQTDLNDSQGLSVRLAVMVPETGTAGQSAYYKITSWQEISTTEWKGDNKLKLIGQE